MNPGSPPARRRTPSPGRRTLAAALTGALLSLVPASPARAAPALLSQGRAATASSVETAALSPAAAVEGDLTGTRWSSQWSDDQWLQVDLGAPADLSRAVLTWEPAYGRSYAIQASDDGADWRTLTTVTAGDGGTDDLPLTGSGRYVRVHGLTRGTGYGFSLWEFQVYGTPADGGPQLPGGGDLGPNVHVLDPATPGLQAELDEVFRQQESAQFGSGRHAFLLKPGTYHGIHAQLGFYTRIAGLGLRPDDTTIHGDVTVDAGWFGGNATQNFWRGAEGLALVPANGTDRWAVSQASSSRRMHIRRGLNLAPTGYGWASGGYIADSRVDGQVGTYSQQQWYTRDSSIGGWSHPVWNQVFSGTEGAPPTSFPEPEYTTLPTTPLSREKPYLIWEDGQYKVFAPALRTDARGTSWAAGAPRGETIPLSRFSVGERGRTVFFQNEKAYDAPNQAAVQNGTTREGWGMGSYCSYNVDPTIRQDHASQAPARPGVRFHSLLTVSLGGNGQFEHVINDTGAPTQGTPTIPSTVVSYP